MTRFNAKLGNMRKAQNFIVYPEGGDPDLITIQSDKRICRFHKDTGKGMLSDGKGGHPGSHRLSEFLGAKPVIVSASIIAECVVPQSGEEIVKGGCIRLA